jgi:SNF2 family DNA or RNA helicase
VEQLPKKVDQIVFCELRPAQRRAYARLVQGADIQALARGFEPCDCNGATEARSRCCHQ